MVILRGVNENDCELLFKWTNDKEVRINSFNSSQVDLDNHKKWFENKLNNKNCKMFIIMKGNNPVGQIRIDIDNNIGLISYSIDTNYRSMGIGTESLRQIKEKYENLLLVGIVKKTNIASTRAFEKAGYEKKENNEYIVFSR